MKDEYKSEEQLEKEKQQRAWFIKEFNPQPLTIKDIEDMQKQNIKGIFEEEDEN